MPFDEAETPREAQDGQLSTLFCLIYLLQGALEVSLRSHMDLSARPCFASEMLGLVSDF